MAHDMKGKMFQTAVIFTVAVLGVALALWMLLATLAAVDGIQ